MVEQYFPAQIEPEWQQHWRDSNAFCVSESDSRPRYFCLEMLPYPSGHLHMGHARNYSIGDALAWYKRLTGHNVLHVIGWDSFGQPAEQAAIRRGVMPQDWTEKNIAHMRGQLQRLGFSYDWGREIAAHRPEYYRWDQWFFLKMYERGLAYKKKSAVNWCPHEETVLSNEQASGGQCWRCGARVVQKELEQWFLRLSQFADSLLEDMGEIADGWPPHVLKRQRDWIGKTDEGFRIRDWGVSRQRFWGAPIPMIDCPHCRWVPVPEKDLPVRLPCQAVFTGTGQSPLTSVEEFVNVECPRCARPARRETDTMDTFVDSSWYFFVIATPITRLRPLTRKWWPPGARWTNMSAATPTQSCT